MPIFVIQKCTDARHTVWINCAFYRVRQKTRSLSCKYRRWTFTQIINCFLVNKAGEWRRGQWGLSKGLSIWYHLGRGDSLSFNRDNPGTGLRKCRQAKPRTLALTFQHASIQPGHSATCQRRPICKGQRLSCKTRYNAFLLLASRRYLKRKVHPNYHWMWRLLSITGHIWLSNDGIDCTVFFVH